jgi:uncharacterized membrane protein YdjX (TVP38/TMEM64 family)
MMEKGTSSKGLWRPIILILVILGVMALAWYFDVGERLKGLEAWIDSLGTWGPLVFVVIYIASVVAALPGSVLTVAAGALFGSVMGVVLVSIASTIGAGLSFLIGRYIARESVEKSLSKSDKFSRLDQLTEEHGDIMVAITRLVPIFPFNLLNYGFGLTKVPFWTYIFWSWLCMLPGTVLYVVGADAVFKGLREKRVPWELLAVLAAIGLILTFLVRTARKKLREGPKGQGGSP